MGGVCLSDGIVLDSLVQQTLKDPSVTGVAPGDKSGATVDWLRLGGNEIGHGLDDFDCDRPYDGVFYGCD